jgi:hypothetical protein
VHRKEDRLAEQEGWRQELNFWTPLTHQKEEAVDMLKNVSEKVLGNVHDCRISLQPAFANGGLKNPHTRCGHILFVSID